MKTTILVAIVGMQILLLTFMAAQHEWVLRTGQSVYLRTLPLDPNDPMRGEYVRLRYDFSRVARDKCSGRLAETRTNFNSLHPDTRVYAALQSDESGVANLVALTLERPANGLYLRGRTERTWDNTLGVRYGLEAFFTEQGASKALERGQAPPNIQVPLEMRAMVGANGMAVLKDYRRCPLGIGLIAETNNLQATNSRSEPRVIALAVSLYNASSNDLAIVDLPAGRSLAIQPEHEGWSWPKAREPQLPPSPAEVVVLKPGQSHSIRIDFNDPFWALMETQGRHLSSGKLRLLNDLSHEWSARFRVQYSPPASTACSNLPNASLIWHGKIASRRFQFVGRID